MKDGGRLPPLRRKIFQQFFVLVSLYIVVGIFMMLAVFFASGVTPRIIHSNYDSISSAANMSEAWHAVRSPNHYKEKSLQAWIAQFEEAISFDENNITEPGEAEIAARIRKRWDKAKVAPSRISNEEFIEMRRDIDQLISVNENGMFGLAEKSERVSRRILVFSIVLFLTSLFFAIYLADGLAVRLSRPLKDFAEALRRKPRLGTKLKLPPPTSFEFKVLTHEMGRLWDRLCDLQKFDLEELSLQSQKLETVLESVDDAIIVLDNRDTILHCNDGMLELLGLKKSDLINHSWRDLSTLGENYLERVKK